MAGRVSPSLCETCGAGVTQPATGRWRRYCSQACRAKAYRSRLALDWPRRFEALRERLVVNPDNGGTS